MNIEQVVNKVKLNIEDERITVNNVGNRPHFPVFVSFSGATSENCLSFIGNIKRIWSSQISKSLLFYKYTIENDGINFIDIDSDNILEKDVIYGRISDVSRTRNVFDSLNSWRLYNVIDTTSMTFEDFEKSYNAKNALHDEIDENITSMAIIILNESRDKERKKINYKIRNFLRNPAIYNGIILVSNRARGGIEYEKVDLYSIVSNVVLLSDNDAVSNVDDESYKNRNLKLYDNAPLTMAYNSLEKPIMDVLYCMTLNLVSTVKEQISLSTNKRVSSSDIEDILGIENNKLTFFDDLIKKLQDKLSKEHFITEFFRCMPLNSPEVFSENIAMLKFSEIKSYISLESLDLFAVSYCNNFIEEQENKQIFNQYNDFIGQHLNLLNIESVSRNRIKETFETLKEHSVISDDEFVCVYFKKYLVNVLKNKIIYPYCINVVDSICDTENIKSARNNIEILANEVNERIPLSEFDEISLLYGNYMLDFLKTDKGNVRINQLLEVDKSYDELISLVEHTLYDANNFCDDTIQFPFIKLWANALKLHDEEIYNRIRNTLSGNGDDEILLRGSYPVNETLSVYVMHCYDRNGDNPTSLYRDFLEAYKNISNVQFFNTGNDDSIESIRFFKCKDTDLILGLEESI